MEIGCVAGLSDFWLASPKLDQNAKYVEQAVIKWSDKRMPVYAIVDKMKGRRQGALGMPLPHLTDKQAQCLAFIGQRYLDSWTYPTRREIAYHMGLNSCSEDSYVGPLSRKGFLTINKTVDKKNVCNIRLTGPPS